MQQTIRNKTLELLDHLSDQHMYYTPKDLLDAGYPDFLVERIQLEIERNLADSVSLPESDWADMRADQVQDAWDHFLNAIRAETRIPVSFCRSVTENAVEDVLDLFSKPRNYILETLFRNENEANYDELSMRRKWIVIHGVLADSVLRYMQRKNLTMLTREKAEYVLVEVDKKLTSGFTPLKWAQHLDLLFQFLENEVPSRILSEYFVDRGMLSESKQINRGNYIVTRNTFIEMISEAGIYEDDEFDTSDTDSSDEVPIIEKNNESINDSANRVDFTIAPDFSDVHVDPTEISDNDSNLDDKNISTDELESSTGDELTTKIDDHDKGEGVDTSSVTTTNTDTITLEQAFELDHQVPSINDFNSDEVDPFDFDDSPEGNSGERLNDTIDDSVNEKLVDSHSEINDENIDDVATKDISNDDLDDNIDNNNSVPQQFVNNDPDPANDFIHEESDLENEASAISDDSHEPDSILNQFLQTEDDYEEPVEENSDLTNESEQFISLADQFLEKADDEIEDSTISASGSGDENTDFDPEKDTIESTFANGSGNVSIQDNIDNREKSTSDITDNSIQESDRPDVQESDELETDENDDSHVIYLTERAKQLLVVIEPNLEEFIREIFLNDELEFYKHLENISAYTEWRMAGRYITRDIYDKNRIDLYSEPAVMFTDAVQEFFDQKEN